MIKSHNHSSIFFIVVGLMLSGCGVFDGDVTYNFSVTASPEEGGIISPSDNSFKDGEEIELHAEPTEGWRFVRWEGDWSTSTNPTKILINKNYNIIGVFERRNYPLIIEIDGQGTVEESIVQAKTTEYPFETVVELTPIPSNGWEFSEWKGDITGDENPLVVTIKDEMNITAVFSVIPPDITTSLLLHGRTSVKFLGEVNSILPLSGKGICISEMENPTTEGDCARMSGGSKNFTATVEDLKTDTKYFARAYATVEGFTEYGNQVEFTTSIFTNSATDIDGNEYQTIKFGEQEWFAENLRVTRYRNGSNIPTNLSNDEWNEMSSDAYAVYSGGFMDDLSYDEIVNAYGMLYNWFAVNDSRGLCPEGWHVPDDDEWTELIDFIYGNDIGNKLKSRRQVDSPLGGEFTTEEHPRWNYNSKHFGTDEFGFDVLPGGNRSKNGAFGLIGFGGYWWSSSESSTTDASLRFQKHNEGSVNMATYNKHYGLSVRCMRN